MPPIADSTPASMYAMSRTCHDRVPAKRAATALSPWAYSIRPKPVYRSIPTIMAVSTAQITTAYGMLPSRNDLPPIVLTNSPTTVDPASHPWAHELKSPKMIPDMAMVMMSGFTRKTPTPMPLAAPAPIPTRIPSPIATNAPFSAWAAVMYAAAVAIMEADRSMPPVIMRTVWLAAMIPTGTAMRAVPRSPLTDR